MVYSTNYDSDLFKYAAIGIVIDSYFKGGSVKLDIGIYNRLLNNDVPATLDLIFTGNIKKGDKSVGNVQN